MIGYISTYVFICLYLAIDMFEYKIINLKDAFIKFATIHICVIINNKG